MCWNPNFSNSVDNRKETLIIFYMDFQKGLAVPIVEIFGLILLVVNFLWIKLFWCSWFNWDNLGKLSWSLQFRSEGLSSFNSKGFCYSYVWSCSLCEGWNSFSTWHLSTCFSSVNHYLFVVSSFWCYFI